MKTTNLLLILALLVIPSCGVVDSVTIHGNYAAYEVKFAKPIEKQK